MPFLGVRADVTALREEHGGMAAPGHASVGDAGGGHECGQLEQRGPVAEPQGVVVVARPVARSGAVRRGRVQPEQVREHRARAVARLSQHDHRALRERHLHVHVVLVKVDASTAVRELEVVERRGRSRLGDAQVMEPRALLLVRERGRRRRRRRRVPGVAMSSRPWSQSCTVLRSLPGPDQARALELLQVVGAHGGKKGRAPGSVRRWRRTVLSLRPQVWRKLSTELNAEKK